MTRHAATVFHLVRNCTGALGLPSTEGFGEVRPSHAGHRVDLWSENAAESLPRLLETVGALGGGSRGPTAGGLLAELRSRPGRYVETWLAWSPERCSSGPLGLVTLVTVNRAGAVRSSIGWLLVAAAWRRRGIGSSLVRTAVTKACDGGATEVWAEVHGGWEGALAFWQRLGFQHR
jgi:GNAT superfamily N-acetyltransferase